jgi:hypothetical protein
MEPSLATQIAVRARLIATPAVTALVAATSIFDRTTRPEKFPAIVIGDGQTVREAITLTRGHVRVFSDLHIWINEGGLEGVKTLAGAVTTGLKAKPTIEGFRVVDWLIHSVRFLRDPGEYGHAIVSIEALVSEAAT